MLSGIEYVSLHSRVTVSVLFLLQMLFKALLKIGEGLIHNKDLRDFFSDLVEKVRYVISLLVLDLCG